MRAAIFLALVVTGQVAVKDPLAKVRVRPGAAYLLTFDAQTVQRLEGRIVKLTPVPSPQVWLSGTQAILQTARGEVHVLLGPTWFIENQELHLAVGDEISVVGSLVRPHGVDALVAMEVHRGDDVLTLRGPDGMPVWVAWRTPPAAP